MWKYKFIYLSRYISRKFFSNIINAFLHFYKTYCSLIFIRNFYLFILKNDRAYYEELIDHIFVRIKYQ